MPGVPFDWHVVVNGPGISRYWPRRASPAGCLTSLTGLRSRYMCRSISRAWCAWFEHSHMARTPTDTQSVGNGLKTLD